MNLLRSSSIDPVNAITWFSVLIIAAFVAVGLIQISL